LRWVDLTVTPPVVSAPVSLPAASDGTPTRVGGMGAVPGAPHSVAVSLIYDAFSTVSGAGTFVFDDGTVRAAHTPAVAIAYPSQIIGGPPGVLFEAFEHSAPAALTTLHVTSTAVTEVQHDPSFAIGGGVYSDGMIYGVANVALDVHDPDHPVVVGPLEAPGVYTYTLTNMQPLVSRPGRVFMVGYDIFGYLDLTLRFADVAAHRAVASSLLSGTGQGDVLDLVSVPPSRMAMLHRTATVDPPTRLFIITHDLLATP
jgi:hypothetical protein